MRDDGQVLHQQETVIAMADDHILLHMDEGESRQLLQKWLGLVYGVRVADGDCELQGDFDLGQ